MSKSDEESHESDKTTPSKKTETFWNELEVKTGLTIPSDLRPMMERLGFANELALLGINKEAIEQLEQFAQKHLAKKVDVKDMKSVFGLFADDPESFIFVPGHRLLLLAIADKIREAKANPPKRPSKEAEQTPSKRLKNRTQTDANVKEEESILRDLLTAGLQKECGVRTDPDKAQHFILTLDSPNEGNILCRMGGCGKKLKVTRTHLRPWGKQNYYRHVRDQHSSKETDTCQRQRSLTDMGVDKITSSSKDGQGGSGSSARSNSQHNDLSLAQEQAIDEEIMIGEDSSNVPGSKWRQMQNSRTVRVQRQLEVAAVGCFKLTDFWPLITKMESVIKENERLHATVRELINRIAEHDPTTVIMNLPGISPFLQALISSAIRNAHRKQGGVRFERDLVLIAAHFFMVAGRKAYTDLHLNLQKIIPSTSSVLRMIDKSKFVPQPGDFMFEKLLDFLLVRKLPLVINIGIDGTRCVSRVQYDPSTNQLVGFVPKLIEGIPALAPFPATSEHVIRQYFESETPGSIMQCIVARPLVRNGPTFCLCAYPTDNKFNASDVSKLYDYIERESAKYGIRVAAHGSDGDSRFLSAMLQRMFPPCDNSLAWRFWFRSSLNIKVPCVQDPIHIGTKMRNFLLRGHEIHMGDFLVSTSHLIFLIQEVSKDQHEVTLTDIDPKDRMNYRSVEKIWNPKVIQLLKEKVADSQATCAYLEMARSAVTSFVDRSLVPSERIFLIWKAVFFFRGWRHWVKTKPTLRLKTSFITSNAYTCVEINAHALLIIIAYHREHAGETNLGELITWYFGSQDNEELFRTLRTMTTTLTTVINFTPLEFNHRVSRAALEKDIQQELGHKFKFSSSRRVAKEQVEFVPQESVLPSNSEILDIVKNAKLDAEVALREVGIDLDIPDVFTIFAEVELDSDEDELDDGPMSVPSVQADTPSPLTADEDELDFQEDLAMASMFSGEVQLRTYNKEVDPNSSFVHVRDFGGNPAVVRKSSLVWMLSKRSKVSNDRALRYHVPTSTPQTPTGILKPSWKAPIREEYLYVGDWAFFEEKTSMFVGRVLGFHYLTGKNKKFTQRSAPTDVPPGTRPRGIGIVANCYIVNRGLEDAADTGLLTKSGKTAISMDFYKFTVSRPLVVGDDLQLDLRTVTLLPV